MLCIMSSNWYQCVLIVFGVRAYNTTQISQGAFTPLCYILNRVRDNGREKNLELVFLFLIIKLPENTKFVELTKYYNIIVLPRLKIHRDAR